MSCAYFLLGAIKVVMVRCHGVVVDKTIGLLQLGAIGVAVIGRHEDSFGYVSWGSWS